MLNGSGVLVPGVFPAIAFSALYFHFHFQLAPVWLEARFLHFLPQKEQGNNECSPNKYEGSYGWNGKFVVAHGVLSSLGQLRSSFVI